MEAILATQSVGISELALNHTAVIESAEGGAIAVLDWNKPVASCCRLACTKRCLTDSKTTRWGSLAGRGKMTPQSR
jgi:hypothetical protein